MNLEEYAELMRKKKPRRLVDIEVEEISLVSSPATRKLFYIKKRSQMMKDLDEAMVMGGPLPYGPVLLPKDGLELGRIWVKGGTNHRGMSLKEFGKGAAGSYKGSEALGAGDYAAVFMAAVQIPALRSTIFYGSSSPKCAPSAPASVPARASSSSSAAPKARDTRCPTRAL